MPILKISQKLKNIGDTSIRLSYPDITSNGKCKDCEMPSTPDNPVISLGRTQDGKHEILAHPGCPSARDRGNERIDHSTRADSANDDNIWYFADRLRHEEKNLIAASTATTTPDNSTVQETFPTAPKTNNEVADMTKKQVDANYDSSGTPVPPKN